MTYLSALGSVLAIIAIVIVGGVIIAFLGNIIMNAFDADRKYGKKVDNEEDEIRNIRDNVYTTPAETKDGAQTTYPNKAEVDEVEDEDDFNYAKEVDGATALKEKEELEKEIKGFDSKELDFDEDDFFKDYKASLKEEEASDDVDDFDLMSMVDEISADVLGTKKAEIDKQEEEESANNSSMLDKYSIDSILNDEEDDEEDEDDALLVEVPSKEEKVDDESLKEMRSIRDDIASMLEELKSSKKVEETVQVATEEIDEIVEDELEEETESIDDKINAEVQRRVDERLQENLQIVEELRKSLEEKEAEIQSAHDSKKEMEERYSKINREMVEQMGSQIQSTVSESFEQIKSLRAQLEDLTRQLEEERAMNWKVAQNVAVEEAEKTIKVVENNVVEKEDVVSDIIEEAIIEDEEVSEVAKEIVEEEIDNRVEEILSQTTEEINEIRERVQEVTTETVVEEVVTMHYSTEAQYLARLEVLEERLKIAKKDLKVNDKEYKPLEKVKRTLDRDKAKLRRKEAIAAKKKVALYGVNNYVDIDKDKAEKLAHELELLDGLRLSVSHCEEVMNANADRYPILERTHIILANNIIDIETDILQLQKELKILRDKNSK